MKNTKNDTLITICLLVIAVSIFIASLIADMKLDK